MITNMRPVRPIGVISGEQSYPDIDTLKQQIQSFSHTAWFLDATEATTRLGNPIFSNVMIVGTLAKIGELPLGKDIFKGVIESRMVGSKVGINLEAFKIGSQLAHA